MSIKIQSTINMYFQGNTVTYSFIKIHFSTGISMSVFKPGDPNLIRREVGVGEEKFQFAYLPLTSKDYYTTIEEDLTNLTEEELFQLETVWEHSIDLYLVREVQLYALSHYPSYDKNTDKSKLQWKQEWEY